MAIIDTLKLAQALRDRGGFAAEAAEATAEAINAAFDEPVATKTDLQHLEATLTADVAVVRAEVRQDIATLGKVISDAKAEVRNRMLAQTFAILAVVAALHFVK